MPASGAQVTGSPRSHDEAHHLAGVAAAATWSMIFRGVPLPGDYYNGILHAALNATGVSSPQSSWEQTGPEDMTFEVRW